MIEAIWIGMGAVVVAALATATVFAIPPTWDRLVEWRTRRRHEHGDTGEHEIIPEPHQGATTDGTGVVVEAEDALGVWVVPMWEARPSIFEELRRRTPVDIDWEGPGSFTETWTRADMRRILAEAR